MLGEKRADSHQPADACIVNCNERGDASDLKTEDNPAASGDAVFDSDSFTTDIGGGTGTQSVNSTNVAPPFNVSVAAWTAERTVATSSIAQSRQRGCERPNPNRHGPDHVSGRSTSNSWFARASRSNRART